MSSPVSSNQINLFYDESFKKDLKDVTHGIIKDNSEVTKKAMKVLVDAYAEQGATAITSAITEYANDNSSGPNAALIVACGDSCLKPTTESSIKRVGHFTVDKCVDSGAKEVVDQSIDKSTNLTNTIYGYFRSKFS